MSFMMMAFSLGFVVGLAAVASNPSPYFAALGLVMGAGMGCGLLMNNGGSFLSLVLVLIYLGGMLVVFAYSAALAAEPYPEAWGSRPVLYLFMIYMVMLVCGGFLLWGKLNWGFWFTADEQDVMGVVRGDVGGVATLYSTGGVVLMISGWVLLLTLFVVLELTRGLDRGTLRAV
uniref:NADH-ubiquinone oxidoreductase chain 6 n=1 Tax=Squalomugil nasutus TaxID=1040953 RepID=I1T2E7_SQUNS|nr:NADH dehydrogenase subunit 6 [Squalomugil nasutus]AEK53169.1 NADH dehydrogenase subunit 6 [Squalomugil nasutus]